MTRKQRRLTLIGTAGTILIVAAGLVLYALTDRIVFFNSPTDIVEKGVTPGKLIRLGGLVEEGSVVRDQGSLVTFSLTDTANIVKVSFDGILPDLFREGQGVIAEGSMDSSGIFIADTVLAKHDENYMPKEVADALKEQGVWQGDEGKTQ
ncbi:MAG: cytochrome c maturation protein CcmE [Hyphomicrobiales bacterium]|nr:cytochrome c maturation protein CcmE [Hyphomicrobiales bacterium]PCJ95702.1 MAG: cytochrome c maturation protein CcmE [Hyphomicrobiales bacterium]